MTCDGSQSKSEFTGRTKTHELFIFFYCQFPYAQNVWAWLSQTHQDFAVFFMVLHNRKITFEKINKHRNNVRMRNIL